MNSRGIVENLIIIIEKRDWMYISYTIFKDL